MVALPIYLYCCYSIADSYRYYNARGNFVDRDAFIVGLGAIFLAAAGSALGYLSTTSSRPSNIKPSTINAVLLTTGWVAIFAYGVFLSVVVIHPDLVIAVIKGSRGASAELHHNVGRVPGLTSLMQVAVAGFALLAGMRASTAYRPSKAVMFVYSALFVLSAIRALVASERLALFEVIFAIAIPWIAFRTRPTVTRELYPLVGALVIFSLFAVAEYFRSWQYYKLIYENYSEFITARFSGYFSTSINNGAGMMHYGEIGDRKVTLEWLWRLPFIGPMIAPPESGAERFLIDYATLEFNNPGGLYVPVNDYGIFWGLFLWLIVGLTVGWSFKKFTNLTPLGLALFPSLFFGLTDLIRIFYWSSTRAFPIIVAAVLISIFLARGARQAPSR